MAFNFADRLLTIRSCHRLMCMCMAYVRDQVTSRPGQFVTRLRPRASGAAPAAAGCPVDFPAARYAFVRSNLA